MLDIPPPPSPPQPYAPLPPVDTSEGIARGDVGGVEERNRSLPPVPEPNSTTSGKIDGNREGDTSFYSSTRSTSPPVADTSAAGSNQNQSQNPNSSPASSGNVNAPVPIAVGWTLVEHGKRGRRRSSSASVSASPSPSSAHPHAHQLPQVSHGSVMMSGSGSGSESQAPPVFGSSERERGRVRTGSGVGASNIAPNAALNGPMSAVSGNGGYIPNPRTVSSSNVPTHAGYGARMEQGQEQGQQQGYGGVTVTRSRTLPSRPGKTSGEGDNVGAPAPAPAPAPVSVDKQNAIAPGHGKEGSAASGTGRNVLKKQKRASMQVQRSGATFGFSHGVAGVAS